MDESSEKPKSENIIKKIISEPRRRLERAVGLFNNAMDLRDFKDPPTKVENPKFNKVLAEKLFPSSEREKLFELSRDLKVGEKRGAIIIVGERRTNTTHPHLYEISKTP